MKNQKASAPRPEHSSKESATSKIPAQAPLAVRLVNQFGSTIERPTDDAALPLVSCQKGDTV